MGARTNYTIVTTSNPAQNINVYSHWDGDESVSIMRNAIAVAMPRLKMGDIGYSTRILIDQLTKDGRDKEAGYGIYICEDVVYEEQYDYKEINLVDGTVTIGEMSFSLWEFAEVTV
jgi:hypothetical protein